MTSIFIARRFQYQFRRLYSSSSSFISHESIAEEIKTRGPWTFVQDFSPTHIHKLNATLASHIELQQNQIPKPKSLPPGYHLIFFNDISPENELASDGYHQNQAPSDSIFPARMWLGGSIEFNNNNNNNNNNNHDNISEKLLIGGHGTAVETISNVEYKSKSIPTTSTDNNDQQLAERIDVTLNRYIFPGAINPPPPIADIEESKNWAIKEKRSLAYFTPTAGSSRKDTFSRIIKCKYINTNNHI